MTPPEQGETPPDLAAPEPADAAAGKKLLSGQYELATFDLDGTSLEIVQGTGPDGEREDWDRVPTAMKLAYFRLARESGTKAAICTGRAPREALRGAGALRRATAEELAQNPGLEDDLALAARIDPDWKFTGLVAASNGAVILDAGTKEILEVHAFARKDLAKARKAVLEILDDAVFALDRAKVGAYEDDFVNLLAANNYEHPWPNPQEKVNIDYLLGDATDEEYATATADGVVRLYAMHPGLTKEKYLEIAEGLSDVATATYVAREGLLEISVKGINKGSGIKRLAKLHGLGDNEPDKVVHIGDDRNDIPAYEVAGAALNVRGKDQTVVNAWAWDVADIVAENEPALAGLNRQLLANFVHNEIQPGFDSGELRNNFDRDTYAAHILDVMAPRSADGTRHLKDEHSAALSEKAFGNLLPGAVAKLRRRIDYEIADAAGVSITWPFGPHGTAAVTHAMMDGELKLEPRQAA